MKKTFFILAAAAAALASCVKSEVVNVSESSAIAFDSFVSKETKATTITSRNELKDFWVSGRIEGDATPLFDKQQLTWNAENQVYAYEPHKTWELGKTYRFAAYSDANEGLTSPASFNYNTTGKNQIEISDYTVDDSKDLLAAIHAPISISSNGSNIPSGRVAFQFAHMLTRVRFEVENTSASDIYIKISDISFGGTKTGDCVYAYDESNQTYSCTWTEDEAGTYTYNFGGGYISKGHTVLVDHFVIPQNNNKEISFNVDSYVKGDNDEYNHSSTIPYTASLEYGDDTWKAGWVYNYLIKVGGAAHYIHFDAAVDNWGYDIDGSGVSTDDDILIEE